NSEPVGERWPASPVTTPSFASVPQSIERDATEAWTCHGVGADRAAAVMARRAVQAAAFDKGAPDKRPVEQIEWLQEHGTITPQMAGLAHHIRSLGGDGAHPDKDG